jgi:hypothetical protein
VRDVLGPHLWRCDVAADTKILATKRIKSGGQFKGGVLSWRQLQREIRLLLHGAGESNVTTLLDYYGLPSDVPGMSSRPPLGPYERVAHVERAISSAIDDTRFVPHVVLHEFEAWVYTAPMQCTWVFDREETPRAMEAIREQAGGPELIDDGNQTAPSKRLLALWPSYEKTLHGPMAVGAMGLDAVRRACPHFAGWLSRLERP